jgi:DNA-binding CsgD family transcriptional regulator
VIQIFDFEDEKEAEAARLISEMERALIRCLDAHRYGIILFDPCGDVLAANQQWQKIYMLSYNEVKDYNILNDENLQGKHIWPAINAAFKGINGTIEENFFSPAEWGMQGRSRWTEGNCFPILADGESGEELLGTAILLNDISDIKQSQLEVERLRQMISDIHGRQMDIIRKLTGHDNIERKMQASRPKTMPNAQEILLAAKTIPRREREVFELLASGCTVKETAHLLNLAAKSVYTYRTRLMERLKVHGSVELAIAWREIQESTGDA